MQIRPIGMSTWCWWSLGTSTGHWPIYLDYGEHPRTPIQIPPGSHAAKKVPGTVNFLCELQIAFERAKMNSLAAQVRQKSDAPQHCKEENLCVAEEVWLSKKHLRIIAAQARLIGPWPIESVVLRWCTMYAAAVCAEVSLPARLCEAQECMADMVVRRNWTQRPLRLGCGLKGPSFPKRSSHGPKSGTDYPDTSSQTLMTQYQTFLATGQKYS